jgi:hypothetical protein
LWREIFWYYNFVWAAPCGKRRTDGFRNPEARRHGRGSKKLTPIEELLFVVLDWTFFCHCFTLIQEILDAFFLLPSKPGAALADDISRQCPP